MVALLAVLLMTPSSAYATAAPYTHGDFANNSKGCGECHVTHAANAAKLLVYGPTQTDMCYFCHGQNATSRFDVQNGLIMRQSADPKVAANWSVGSTVYSASYAGGFSYSYDFQSNQLKASTSVHSVEKMYDASDSGNNIPWTLGKEIPGGSGTLSADFRCGSCHDPHKGGAYDPLAANYKNPRLLKPQLLGEAKTTFRAVYLTIDQNTNLLTAYGFNHANTPNSGISNWCAGCHDVFNVNNFNADANLKYKHSMGVSPTSSPLLTGKLTLGLLAYDAQNKMTCLTCHKAHGTSATFSGTFQIYKDYNNLGKTNSTSSTLLRLNERDACYFCHGAGEYR